MLIAGGGKLPQTVRHRFVELAGGTNAKLVVIPAHSVSPDEAVQHREGWSKIDGVDTVDVLCTESRDDANNPENCRCLENATGVWIGGGAQTWLVGRYGGTLVERRLKEVLARNGVVGGTSAGAAVMSDVMIAGGREKPTLSKGFGLVSCAVIDQHFVKRNRMRRLQAALNQHPDLIGFGIDEGSALMFHLKSESFRVVGDSVVVACIPHGPGKGSTVEFLNPGDEYHVKGLRDNIPAPPSYIDMDALLFGE